MARCVFPQQDYVEGSRQPQMFLPPPWPLFPSGHFRNNPWFWARKFEDNIRIRQDKGNTLGNPLSESPGKDEQAYQVCYNLHDGS